MKKASWFVFFSIVAISCLDEPDCFQLNNNVIGLNFKILGGGTDSYPVNSIMSPASDSVFVENDFVSGLELPLNPMEKQTDFNIQAPDGNHTLELSYGVQVQFVSADCGERYVFTNLGASSADFDSIRIVTTTPTNPTSPNIEIYRCPRTFLAGVKFTTAIAIQSISAVGLGVIYDFIDPVESVALPVNTASNTTTFVFDYMDGTSKRLTMTYATTDTTLFKLCGEQIIVDSLRFDPLVTDFLSTQITIPKDSIEDLPVTNFEITP